MRSTQTVIIISIIALLCVQGRLKAQSKFSQQAELVGYNIGFGIVSTTIGSLINKPKYAKAWPYIRKSLWQGALGGALQYSGKALTYQITRTDNDWWGWGSKIVHSAGTSICINAALNNPFGQYWVLDYGPARLNFDVVHGSVKCQPQFNILFINDLYQGLYHGKLDWEKSIKSGTVTFQSYRERIILSIPAVGVTYTRSIKLATTATPQITAHELVHIYQGNEYRIFNTYFKPTIDKIRNPTIKNIFRYVNIELPYLWIPYSLFYNKKYYYRNPFEFEAQFFSTNDFVYRNWVIFE